MTNPHSSIALLERTLAANATAGPYRVLPLSRIKPNPDQPRRAFAEDLDTALKAPEFEELVASIRVTGRVLQPLLVQPPDRQGNYLIVAGERRYHAALKAGLTEVPALLVEESDPFTLKLYSLIENLHRQDLSLWDRANFLAHLLEESGLPKKDLAARLGITPSQLSKYLAVLASPPDLLAAVQEQIVADTETVRLLKEVQPEIRASILDKARSSGTPVSRRHAEKAVGGSRRAPSLPDNAAAPEALLSLPRLTRSQLEALLRYLGAERLPEDPASLASLFLELVNRLT